MSLSDDNRIDQVHHIFVAMDSPVGLDFYKLYMLLHISLNILASSGLELYVLIEFYIKLLTNVYRQITCILFHIQT